MSYFNTNSTSSNAYIITEEQLNDIIDAIVKKLIKAFQIDDDTKQVNEELLTINEVVKQYGISRATLNRWEKLNYLIPKRLGKKCFYERGQIKKAMTN